MISISQLFLEKLSWGGMAYQYQPAMVFLKKDGVEIEYTWFDYKEKTLQAMEGLKGRGLKAGEFVAIIALNLPESFFAMLGAILMRAVPVPINVMLLKEKEQKELKKILDDCKPGLVLGNGCLKKLLPEYCIPIEQIISEGVEKIAGKPYGKNVNPAPRQIAIPIDERDPQEMLIMPYTSGTSGQPKGVMLSTEAVLDRVAAINDALETIKNGRVLSYLPLGHISELVATFFGQIYKGYTIYFTEYIEEMVRDREKFRKAFPEILRQVQPTTFLAVPKVWINFQKEIQKKMNGIVPRVLKRLKTGRKLLIKLVKKELGFINTRIFISAGAPIDQSIIEFFKNLEINIDDIYGQTEASGPVLINGQPIGNIRVMINYHQGKEEILVQGKSLMLGYYNNLEATLQAIENLNGSGELVYHTGDAGIWGKGLAQLIYAGRLDDGFKLANGEFVSAPKLYELENRLKKIEDVEEAIICGEGKPFLVALIFTNGDFLQSCTLFRTKIIKNIKEHLIEKGEGIYKVKFFELLDKDGLELTPTMKVRRKLVIKKFQEVIDRLTT
ncbi:MAG: long-chain acyl-CoA synthetase [Parcubacteria group bacterium Gr01-1014_44]|nr:MAG: long-chain acyl-CoA synthetase [Parcubacteria group bacterium Gr01-1014_44]